MDGAAVTGGVCHHDVHHATQSAPSISHMLMPSSSLQRRTSLSPLNGSGTALHPISRTLTSLKSPNNRGTTREGGQVVA